MRDLESIPGLDRKSIYLISSLWDVEDNITPDMLYELGIPNLAVVMESFDFTPWTLADWHMDRQEIMAGSKPNYADYYDDIWEREKGFSFSGFNNNCQPMHQMSTQDPKYMYKWQWQKNKYQQYKRQEIRSKQPGMTRSKHMQNPKFRASKEMNLSNKKGKSEVCDSIGGVVLQKERGVYDEVLDVVNARPKQGSWSNRANTMAQISEPSRCTDARAQKLFKQNAQVSTGVENFHAKSVSTKSVNGSGCPKLSNDLRCISHTETNKKLNTKLKTELALKQPKLQPNQISTKKCCDVEPREVDILHEEIQNIRQDRMYTEKVSQLNEKILTCVPGKEESKIEESHKKNGLKVSHLETLPLADEGGTPQLKKRNKCEIQVNYGTCQPLKEDPRKNEAIVSHFETFPIAIEAVKETQRKQEKGFSPKNTSIKAQPLIEDTPNIRAKASYLETLPNHKAPCREVNEIKRYETNINTPEIEELSVNREPLSLDEETVSFVETSPFKGRSKIEDFQKEEKMRLCSKVTSTNKIQIEEDYLNIEEQVSLNTTETFPTNTSIQACEHKMRKELNHNFPSSKDDLPGQSCHVEKADCVEDIERLVLYSEVMWQVDNHLAYESQANTGKEDRLTHSEIVKVETDPDQRGSAYSYAINTPPPDPEYRMWINPNANVHFNAESVDKEYKTCMTPSRKCRMRGPSFIIRSCLIEDHIKKWESILTRFEECGCPHM